MAKYLLQGSYTAEGLKGLQKEKASGRKAAVEKLFASIGGKVDAMYYSFGYHDVVLIVDAPDNVSIAAAGLTASASGMVRTKTTPLLTVEEADKALGEGVDYRAPGR